MSGAPSSYVPDSYGRNLYEVDPQFDALLRVYLPGDLFSHLRPHLVRLGGLAGSTLDELAGTADRNPPALRHRTRNGGDRQSVVKHPAYQELERFAYSEYGLAALSHRGGVLGWPDPMPPAAKYALTFLFVQAEFGLCCPVSMTDSLTRTLRKFGSPALVARYLPALTSQDMDVLAQGAMFMTEHGAGSDVGATATVAREAADGSWRLYGDKWFCSNPDAGLAMVLARPEGAVNGTKGLALFLLPRELPDGSPNGYRILRLKDKLGYPLHGERRDPPRRRHRLSRRRSRSRLRADDRHDQQLAPLERRPRRRADAARAERGAVRRQRAQRLRPAPDRAAADAAPAGEDDGVDRAGAHDDVPDRRGAGRARTRGTPRRGSSCAS